MIVDEETTKDVRASAQGLYNLIIIGFGTIFGNLLVAYLGQIAQPDPKGPMNYRVLFAVPMLIAFASAAALLLFYPAPQKKAE